MEPNNPQSSIDRIGPWLILIAVGCGLLVLASDFFSAVITVLLEPTFLRGFGLMLLQVVLLSAIGGGAGFAVAELALCNEWLTQSMIRFLRLGRWLPFFVVWATPVWWIQWSKRLAAPQWTEPIFQLVIAMLPTVIFTACYFYLSARHRLQLNRRAAAFTILTPIASDTLLLSFLLQITLYANGWQWFFAPIDFEQMARPSATALLVGGFSFLLYWISGSKLERTAIMNGTAIVRQLREMNWISFFGAGILWFLCFALWDRLHVFISDIFAIASLQAVGRASYKVLTTGLVIANIEGPVWPDVAVSAQELAEGLLLTGLVAIIAVKILRVAAGSTIRSSWVFALTHTVPVVLAIFSIRWIGISHWLKR
jgi:hypothetical protein